MARRRKHHRKSSRRRHRVGAMALNASSPLVMYGSIGLGFLLGDTFNGLLNKVVPASMQTDPAKTGKMLAIGQGGLGAALIWMKGKKSLAKTVAGGVLLGSGLKRATVVFKAGATTMGGYGDVPVIGAYVAPGQLNGRRRVAGYGDVPVVGSFAVPGALNGGSKMMGSMNPSGSTLMG